MNIMDETSKVADCIYVAIDELNEQLPSDEQISKARDTPLSSDGSLDSLATISLMYTIEREVESRLGVAIALADRLVTTEDDPFATVGHLTDFVSEVILQAKRAA